MFPPQGIGVGVGVSIGAKRSNTVIIAAHDSIDKSGADYVCNGIDDQVTINSAISAISSTGGTVLLLEGTYIITDSIYLYSNIALVGQGSGTIIKIPDYLNASLSVIYCYDVSRVLVANLRIDGNRANQTGGEMDGIVLDSATYSKVMNCWVENMLNEGIWCENSNNNTIIGNICWGNCDGVGLYNSHYNTVISNICLGNSEEGIYIGKSSNNIIVGNICQGNGEDGIHSEIRYSNNNTIAYNICIENVSDGIYLKNTSYNTIEGNVCQGNGSDGIYLRFSDNNTIESNVCQGNSENGIELYYSNNSIVIGNVCQENGDNGIYLMGSYNIISSNTIKNNGSNGICIEYFSSNNNIVGNRIVGNSQASDNDYDGIYLYYSSDYNLISSNLIRRGDTTNQQRYGIYIDRYCNSNVIHGNDLYQAGKTADFYDIDNTSIFHNNRTTQGWVP